MDIFFFFLCLAGIMELNFLFIFNNKLLNGAVYFGNSSEMSRLSSEKKHKFLLSLLVYLKPNSVAPVKSGQD